MQEKFPMPCFPVSVCPYFRISPFLLSLNLYPLSLVILTPRKFVISFMRKYFNILSIFMFLITLTSCGSLEKEKIPPTSPFDDDVAFLKKYADVIELTSPSGKAKIAVMPALQARVMTSTSGPPENLSYGWI